MLLIFPFYLYSHSIRVYIFPEIIISFVAFYYISYVISRNISDILRKNSVLAGGLIFSISMVLIFYSNNYLIFLIISAFLGFSSAIIDYWDATYRKINNNPYIYTGITMVVIFVALYFTIKIIYIILALFIFLVFFSAAFTMFTYQNTNFKKTLLIKKLKRYIISVGDIKRVRNSHALFYAILVNSLLYISIAIILISFPLLAVRLHAIKIVYGMIGVSAISFFTMFLGSLLKSRISRGISFVSIFPIFIIIGFAISIKDAPKNLIYGILFIPIITFMIPGYRSYISSRFPRSEIYYVNKFANFFSGISIVLVPVITLAMIGFPQYIIIVELIASMVALLICLKFINYPEIVPPRKT
jgi:hypothetical protein